MRSREKRVIIVVMIMVVVEDDLCCRFEIGEREEEEYWWNIERDGGYYSTFDKGHVNYNINKSTMLSTLSESD
jgi:hypothetical protein